MRNRAGWLALAVLVAATLLMVFFVLPRISPEGERISDAVNKAGETVKEAVTEPTLPAETPKAPAEDAAKTPENAGSQQAQAPAAATPAPTTPAPVTPAFDVLRVEPDGSTVIAGRAEPGATVEVNADDTAIASVKVGPSGDFAIALDEPLPAGDHQLVLKSTTEDGRTIISEETATISVPGNNSGKLLAMVTKPGKASRLISVPDAGSIAKQGRTEQPAGDTSNPALPAMPDAASDLVASAPPIATTTSPAPSALPTPPAAAAPELQVTAVEIEGNRIFIAGTAPSGASLLGFAGETPIGRAKAGPDGHFVIDGTIELSVGQHIIAVEMLDSNGKAALRVDVPFNRPAGEQVAAVAGQQGPTSVSPIDGGAFDKLRNEAGQAFALLRGLYEGGKEPTAEELAAARSATGIALKSLSEYRLPAGSDASTQAIVEKTAKEAGDALAAVDKLPAEADAVREELGKVGEGVERAVGSAIPQAEPMSTEVAQGGDTDGPKTIAQAPLTHAGNSVIIRRGDTLWQISRRVYGQGVRYTTIYLANQDQISNPDLIEPGQIFGVPDEALPDAEEMHRKRLQKLIQ